MKDAVSQNATGFFLISATDSSEKFYKSVGMRVGTGFYYLTRRDMDAILAAFESGKKKAK